MYKVIVIHSCEQCPHYGSFKDNDGTDYAWCFMADSGFNATDDLIPEWCPLPDKREEE